MLERVHITCFASAYALAFLLEISRLLVRTRLRTLLALGLTGAGLLAQTAYIFMRAEPEGRRAALASWHDWLLLASWGVAWAYLLLAVRRPKSAAGVFLLPLTLALTGAGALLRNASPFPRDQALAVWGVVHGLTLLLGVIVVTLGCAAGIMYLVLSYRLKHKLPPREGLELFTLERLQKANRRALFVSSALLAAGLLAGVALNVAQPGRGVPWYDPVVITSGLLFGWLVLVVAFELLYRPARQGRKVAYLTLASFVFLTLVLGVVLWSPSQHLATSDDGRTSQSTGQSAGHWTAPAR